MSFGELTVLAVVPARGGSKSIPRKNLQVIRGLSLVARAGVVASGLEWLDAAVLSTDDPEIAAEGRAHGLDVPFMRPNDLSGDFATSIEMWRHAWRESERSYGRRFDLSILLEPTSPLRQPEDIERTLRTLLDGGHKAAATVSVTPAHYSPHKTLTVNNGTIGFYHEAGARHAIRQTIPTYFHRNGLCYAVRRSTLLDEGTIIESDCAAVIIDRPVVNIDEQFDLLLADFLLSQQESPKFREDQP